MIKNEIQPKYIIPSVYKLIYSKPYKDVYLDENNQALLSIWNNKSELIDNEIYKNECFKILELVIEHSIESLISDVTMNRFIIPAELQSWYSKEIAPQFGKAGLKKCALIVESDLAMMGSLEEVANSAYKEAGSVFLQMRFFSDLSSAHQWTQR